MDKLKTLIGIGLGSALLASTIVVTGVDHFDLLTKLQAQNNYICYGNVRIESSIVDGQEVYTVTHIGSDATDVVIPAEINGIPVSSISADAFKDCKDNLESVTIDGNVTIEKGTFNNCPNELDFTITGDATSLNYGEIFVNTTLGTITIPETVTYVSSKTFYGVTDTTNFVYEGSFENFWGSNGKDGIFGSLWSAFKSTNSSGKTPSMPTNININDVVYHTSQNDLSTSAVKYCNSKNKDAFGYRIWQGYYKNDKNL